MAKIEKNCEHCNESFMTDTREVNRGRGKFCSRTCANSLPRNQSITKICKHCSRTYLTSSRTSKYCSNLCKQKITVNLQK